uniref:Uncharacterized protein n=1 Tax=Falco tinnunculus TaxID=100819 RepID=A0A8C4XTM3_FALTI
ISGSKSSRGTALFNNPTSSSNSVANTEEGNLIDGALETNKKPTSQYTCSHHLCQEKLVMGTQSILTLC